MGGKQHSTKREFEVLDVDTQVELAETEEMICSDGSNWLPVAEIKVGTRFRKDLGDLTQLKESINEIGLLQPIVVDEENRLIAGFRRVEACKQLNWINIPIHRVELKDLLKGEFHENTVRKDFTFSEVVAIKRALEPEIRADAKQRQGTRTDLGNKPSGKFPESRTRDIIGRYVGLSGRQVEKVETIVDAAEREPEQFGKLLEAIDSGKTSIHYGYQKVKRAERHNNPVPLPEGQFDVIYADPPWKYSYSAIHGNAEIEYPTMELADLCKLKLPVAPNSVLFLWTTNPFIPQALELMEVWGFEYKTNMVWVKNGNGGIGLGHFFRGDHELLLVGKQGNMPTPLKPRSSVLNVPKTAHSKKPDEAYAIIEQMYPNRKYLELFARQARKGWKSWGYEVGN